jgi:hypothetical protein
MSIGLVSENNLPSVYKRTVIEDEGVVVLEVGRTKLKIPFASFSAVANALSTFAEHGKPTMEPGWTISLKDEFTGRSTTVVASTLLDVMQALGTFAVKKGIYTPEVPPVIDTAPEPETAKPVRQRRAAKSKSESVQAQPTEPTPAIAAPEGQVNAAPLATETPATAGGRKAGRSKAVAKPDAPEPSPQASKVPEGVATARQPLPTLQKTKGRKAKIAAAEPENIEAAPAPQQSKPGKKAKAATEPKAKSTLKGTKAQAEPAVTAESKQDEPAAASPAISVRSAPKGRSRKGADAEAPASTASGAPLAVPKFTGGPLVRALVEDHPAPEAFVPAEGLPDYMKPYRMAYLIDGDFRFDFTLLQIDPKSRRKVLGIPTDPNATTVPGYEIKSHGDHVGWIIVEEKELIATDLPNVKNSLQKNAGGQMGGLILKMVHGVIPAVQKLRKAA